MRLLRGAIGLLAVGVLAYLAGVTGLVDRLTHADIVAQRAAYGASAGVMSIVAGFSVTTMFFFAAASDSPTLRDFRRAWGPQMNALMIQAFVTTVLAAGCAVGALLAAPSSTASYLFAVAVLVALWQLVVVSTFAWAMLQARARDEQVMVVDHDAPSERKPAEV